MNYLLHYKLLISSRKIRECAPGIYYEKHHIIPRCLGGSDDTANLVNLTAKEHYMAHLLLWKVSKNSKLGFAFASMSLHKDKRKLTAKQYDTIKNIPYFHTEETKKKCGIKGRKCSSETIEKMKQRIFTDEHRQKLSESAKNKPPVTDEAKQRMSDSAKKKPPVSEETKRKLAEKTKASWEKRKSQK